MICTSLQYKDYGQILRILENPLVEMAEIRLDRCPLSDEEIRDLFGNSDTPLIATCRSDEAGADNARKLLQTAIEAGARFVDLEIEAPVQTSKAIQKLCSRCGTELIRSYHNSECTPTDDELQKILARCFRYGADIAKIVTKCETPGDYARINSLYSIILEEVSSLQGRLIAFGLGEEARDSRVECLKRGAPFSYAAMSAEDAAAPGQWPLEEFHKAVYGGTEPYVRTGLKMPASKSFSQRAIIAAALAEGVSRLCGYTPCADSEAAVGVARSLGAGVCQEGTTLVIKGIGPVSQPLQVGRLSAGESGLLARLMIPLLAALNGGDAMIEGEGTLTRRSLTDASEIMAAFGVILKGSKIPLTVHGRLIPGTADISGQSGSQLISGLLMALPLCDKPSTIYVNEPKSIPYMYITLDVLRRFGIKTRTEMEGDAELLESQDWSDCSGISFSIKEKQSYKAADFDIEGDWSSAANFMVAGAVFGSVEIEGLDLQSLQADITITDILVDAGAVVSQLELPADENHPGSASKSLVCVRKAPLEAFETDLNHAPDLFPITAVLAAFCSGESRISGVERLRNKESDRAQAILGMMLSFGVEAWLDGDDMVIEGETLTSRLLNGRLLRGGKFSSYHDHRMVMALKVAALGAGSPVIIDDEDCVAKSFPGFNILFTHSDE